MDSLARELGVEILVQNPSVNGNTTRQALERMAYDVQSHAPGLLLIQFGMNDCNYWVSDQGHPRVAPEAFAANLAEMVRRGRNFGAREVFLLTNHPSGRTAEPLPHVSITYEDSNRRYNSVIREVAEAFPGEVTLIDVEKMFAKPVAEHPDGIRRFLLPDLLHLSEAGHDLYLQIVSPYVMRGVSGFYRR
jgi:lysophospholipase L1-like esterase